jgi:hypothetical protein
MLVSRRCATGSTANEEARSRGNSGLATNWHPLARNGYGDLTAERKFSGGHIPPSLGLDDVTLGRVDATQTMNCDYQYSRIVHVNPTSSKHISGQRARNADG